MEHLIEKSESLTRRVKTTFRRFLLETINWDNRLVAIKGPRGTGKTTMLLQRLNDMGKTASEAVYFSLDDLYFSGHTLVETAEAFHKKGGTCLFLDEVHKYRGWAREIKNMYDFYPDLRIVFTGSSIIDISKEEGDLSRRVRMYELPGLSFREYLEYTGAHSQPPLALEDIIDGKALWKKKFPADFKPFKYFSEYLSHGYYPFFTEDPEGFRDRLNQLIRTVVEYDMAELKGFDIRNAKKLMQLLYILAANVPFKPNISKLAAKSLIHRNSVIAYLHFLEQARLIRLLYSSGISIAQLQKPEKIYLDNPNLSFALGINAPDQGNLRETFFLNQLSVKHTVRYPSKGDFIVDERFTFEVGGRGKKREQISSVPDSFIVLDDTVFPVGSLPLWVFGFLY